ncbi:MAG: 50S ribosomal protein L5 [Candidatus Caldatribacteriota bacterium]|nr:50S ribosomal protein L5 [Atribacterota bacterium]MDD3030919.1 50S ribosomal protein L5 [Atribacterota bacterium]MDD3641343.1 50S ribosomal protein L5 [Atribacterota bacterium]MDD4288491.1 50S ribosomal protein L5 [Atribacterota bacterium]MDD4764324.1 50S ribosomal protein L5 [Atribacterota bacterium]
MVPRLKQKYQQEVIPAIMKKYNYTNKMAVPKIEKIVINMGLGKAREDAKIIDEATEVITAITGQKPVITKSSKSISNFSIRKGMPVGCKVTLRSNRMYEFLDRLINVAIARIRDFQGISPDSFDGRGNYTLGIKEQLIFPEIEFDRVNTTLGMNITIATDSKNDEEAKELLRLIGMPFKKDE